VREKERRRVTRDRLLSAGFSYAIVARVEGVSPQAIHKYAQRKGYDTQRIQYPREYREYNPQLLLDNRVEVELDYKMLSWFSEDDAGKERRHTNWCAAFVTKVGSEIIWGYADTQVTGRGEPADLALEALTDAIQRGLEQEINERIILIDRYFKKLITLLEKEGWQVCVVPRKLRIQYHRQGLLNDKYIIFRSVERKIGHISTQVYPTCKKHRRWLNYSRTYRGGYPQEYYDLVRSVWRVVIATHFMEVFEEPQQAIYEWVIKTERLLQKCMEIRVQQKAKVRIPIRLG